MFYRSAIDMSNRLPSARYGIKLLAMALVNATLEVNVALIILLFVSPINYKLKLFDVYHIEAYTSSKFVSTSITLVFSVLHSADGILVYYFVISKLSCFKDFMAIFPICTVHKFEYFI